MYMTNRLFLTVMLIQDTTNMPAPNTQFPTTMNWTYVRIFVGQWIYILTNEYSTTLLSKKHGWKKSLVIDKHDVMH